MPSPARGPAPAIPTGLRDLGFARIGDLIGQPRAPLTLRFDNAPEITVQARIRQPSAHDMAH